MRIFLHRLNTSLQHFWVGLRQWSGDAAYEHYLECAVRHRGSRILSESEFYLEQLNRRYSRPNRCC